MARHLALGLLLLAASAAAVSAKHPLLVDRLMGSSEAANAAAANARPASYSDTARACFTETTVCGDAWGTNAGSWTSTFTCSDCNPGSSYYNDERYEHEGIMFNPSSSPAGWCFFETSPSVDVLPLPGGAHADLGVAGWFHAACYFAEAGKDSCLPDECGETHLVVSAPYFKSEKMLFSVNPATATGPASCDDSKRRAAKKAAAKAAPKAARAETAYYAPDDTAPTFYEGEGFMYAGAGTLYSRRGPFKGQPKSVWFQYAWGDPDAAPADYTDITNAGDRTVYTPWSYTIDFPTAAAGGKDEYHRYRK